MSQVKELGKMLYIRKANWYQWLGIQRSLMIEVKLSAHLICQQSHGLPVATESSLW